MSQSAPPAEEPSMLTLEERLAVVNLYEELGSYRAVAAVVGCDHKTVKAVIERGSTSCRSAALAPAFEADRSLPGDGGAKGREQPGSDPQPAPAPAPEGGRL